MKLHDFIAVADLTKNLRVYAYEGLLFSLDYGMTDANKGASFEELAKSEVVEVFISTDGVLSVYIQL